MSAHETASGAAPPPGRRWPGRALPVGLPALGGVAALAWAAGVEKVAPSPAWVLLGLGGVAMVLTGMALWRTFEPLLGAGAAAGAAGGALNVASVRELEREKQVVLKAIKEVELDFQMKKIAEADYKEMTERYRGRALRLLKELDAAEVGSYRELIERELRERLERGDAGEPGREAKGREAQGSEAKGSEAKGSAGEGREPKGREGEGREAEGSEGGQGGEPVAGVACGKCQTRNDDDAEFCKRCGNKLAR